MNINKKRLGFRANLSIITIAFIAAIVVINVIVSVLVEKFPLKIDLTENKIFNLSTVTKDILEGLEQEVVIYYLAQEAGATVGETLNQYVTHSSKVTVQYVNAEKNPQFPASFPDVDNLSQDSIIVSLADKSRYLHISPYDIFNQSSKSLLLEEKLTNAIDYCVNPKEGKIYSTQGHGEQVPPSLSSMLKSENIETDDVILMQGIPDDARALNIITPILDFTDSDIAKLDEFIEQGGNLVISLGAGAPVLPVFEDYLRTDWGIELKNDVVLESDPRFMVQSSYYLTPSVLSTDLTSSILSKNLRPIMPESRSLTAVNIPGIEAQPLFTTSEKARTASFVDANNISVNEGEQAVTLGYLVTKYTRSQQPVSLIITGSSLWLDEDYLRFESAANYSFMRATFNYAMGAMDSELIIPSKNLESPPLLLDLATARGYAALFVLILPAAVLVFGGVIWFRRRSL